MQENDRNATRRSDQRWKTKGHGPNIFRWHCEKPLVDGMTPRGGSPRPTHEIVVRFVDDPITDPEEIYANLGVADGGRRTPYEELHPRVTPLPFERTIFPDLHGGRTVIEKPIPLESLSVEQRYELGSRFGIVFSEPPQQNTCL